MSVNFNPLTSSIVGAEAAVNARQREAATLAMQEHMGDLNKEEIDKETGAAHSEHVVRDEDAFIPTPTADAGVENAMYAGVLPAEDPEVRRRQQDARTEERGSGEALAAEESGRRTVQGGGRPAAEDTNVKIVDATGVRRPDLEIIADLRDGTDPKAWAVAEEMVRNQVEIKPGRPPVVAESLKGLHNVDGTAPIVTASAPFHDAVAVDLCDPTTCPGRAVHQPIVHDFEALPA